MNRFAFYFALSLALSMVTCQETRDELNKPITEKDIYKTIGEEIPFETGMQWIKYYQDQQSGQGRTELLSSYIVSSEQMQEMEASVTDLVGVAFHHAIDDNGEKHIILIPLDGTLRLWTSISGRIFVDANTGEEISQSVAAAWAQNYKDQNPYKVWFHFFGKDIFDQMNALPFFNSVDIQPGVNILNLTPQLLLVVWNDDLISIGRTQDSPAVVYDASNACPPCAAR
jgi:hypothetical protein